MCTELLPPDGNPIAVKKYVKYQKIRENETGRRTFVSKREEFTGEKRII
jgi:hypothetical protein